MPAAKNAASKAAPTKSAAPQDAVQLLTSDHDEVKDLFEKYKKLVTDNANVSDRQALAETICDKLTEHADIEEEIFYPAAREALEADDLLDEAEVEHASAKWLIAQIKDMDPNEDLYDAKVTVLGGLIFFNSWLDLSRVAVVETPAHVPIALADVVTLDPKASAKIRMALGRCSSAHLFPRPLTYEQHLASRVGHVSLYRDQSDPH